MLAKELKIANLKKQREVIAKALKSKKNSCDGSVDLIYPGSVYPEVIEYFEKEGIKFTLIDFTKTGGLPAYHITIENVKLTEEELAEAEAYEPEEGENLLSFMKFFDQMARSCE